MILRSSSKKGSKGAQLNIPLTIFEGKEDDEEEELEASSRERVRIKSNSSNIVKDNLKVNELNKQLVIIPITKTEISENIKNAILPLKNEEKYCPEVYKFKTGKKDSNEYQIAIVFPECKKGGKKIFYSRKGRRNKRSRKTRKRK